LVEGSNPYECAKTGDRLGVGGISKIFTSYFDCSHLCKRYRNIEVYVLV